jgi:UDP-glucose 4-epimerase
MGGCGFLGQSLAEHLSSKGFDIRIFDLPEVLSRYKQTDQRFTRIAGDFSVLENDDNLFSDIDTVFHLIHTTIPVTSMKDAFHDAASNIIPSIRLFRIVAERRISKLIFLSSGGTVYGVSRKAPISEDDPTNPICPYGVSKLAIERYLQHFSSQHGFKGISVRLSNPFGKHQLPGKPIGAIANFLSRTAQNQEIEIWGDGSIVRDYLYISDVMNALERIVESETIPSGVYNLGFGTGHSLNQILDLVRKTSRKNLTVTYKEQRDFDVPEIVLDCTRIKNDIPWRPEIELAEGIEKLWRYLSK